MWKQIPYFETYEVSDEGYVRNKKTGYVLKNSTSGPDKALVVSLVNSERTSVMNVRHIVYCTFNDIDILAKPIPRLKHYDGNLLNCSLPNLYVPSVEDLPGEEWRPVPAPGFETMYAVSNKGRVKSLIRLETYIRSDTGKECTRYRQEFILTLSNSEDDKYQDVGFVHNNNISYWSVHQLVATAFIPNPENKPTVNHIDGNPENNCVENLEWATYEEQVEHAIRTGLRGPQKGIDRSARHVRCVETDQIFDSMTQACKVLNITYNEMQDAINRNVPKHGLHFETWKTDYRVKCLDNNNVYPTMQTAMDELHVSSIQYAIDNHTCTNGYTFCWVKDLDNIDEVAYLEECRANYCKWPRAIKRWKET